ncbi:MAG: deoxyhypusine synthase family protein [Sedimentisphaerales bacterium]|nr:deoxyhypusine synthase family protein [Sedimentisphaerales bacterium]
MDLCKIEVRASARAAVVDMDFFEALGFRHYRDTSVTDDKELRELYIDRIHDTYIDEEQLQVCDGTIQEIADGLEPRPYSSRRTKMKATWSQGAQGQAAVPPVRSKFAGRNKVLVLLLGLLVLAGCGDRDAQEARQEAADAKATVARLELKLAGAVQELSKTKDELKAVRQTRDELQEQMDGLQQERDQALVLSQQAKEVITNLTARSSNQARTTASLEKQIDELKALVEEQQRVIEDFQKTAAAHPAETETSKDESAPAEPNDKP